MRCGREFFSLLAFACLPAVAPTAPKKLFTRLGLENRLRALELWPFDR